MRPASTFSIIQLSNSRAEIVKDAILKRIPVKDVVLLDTAGVSTMYANDGGVIVVI